jgi:hypothetical protein
MARQNPSRSPAETLRLDAAAFLGNIPANPTTESGDGGGAGDGANRSNELGADAGATDPSGLGAQPAPPRRRGRPPGKSNADYAKARAGTEEKEKLVVEPAPPDPTILGFATEGLKFLNAALAARTGSPEFAAITHAQAEAVAGAWLKFASYYVSLAKATGPMAALAAAIMTTAFVYAPPVFVTMQRSRAKPSDQVRGSDAPAPEMTVQ